MESYKHHLAKKVKTICLECFLREEHFVLLQHIIIKWVTHDSLDEALVNDQLHTGVQKGLKYTTLCQ